MKTTVTYAGFQVDPGTKVQGYLPVKDSEVQIPFTIINGSISSDTVPLIIVPGACAKPASGKAANAPNMICRYRVFIQLIKLLI